MSLTYVCTASNSGRAPKHHCTLSTIQMTPQSPMSPTSTSWNPPYNHCPCIGLTFKTTRSLSTADRTSTNAGSEDPECFMDQPINLIFALTPQECQWLVTMAFPCFSVGYCGVVCSILLLHSWSNIHWVILPYMYNSCYVFQYQMAHILLSLFNR